MSLHGDVGRRSDGRPDTYTDEDLRKKETK